MIAIDRLPERLELARSIGAITVDYSVEGLSVLTALKDLTGGIGPDSCIDAVGLEAHSAQLQGVYDKVKTALMMETDRPIVLRQAIQAVRKGGTVSIPGVYGGLLDKVPFGAAFGKGITIKMGQTNMQRALWRVLAVVASFDLRLRGIDFAELIARAESQHERVEEQRLACAQLVFRLGVHEPVHK